MKLNRAIKIRIYPNREQSGLLQKTFGSCRFIYNQMLSDKIEYYKEHKEKLMTTPAQYLKDDLKDRPHKSKFEWLKEVDSMALCNEQLHLQKAYAAFFRNPKTGFPKYKSKHKDKKSYVSNNVKLCDKCVYLPKVGNVKAKLHRLPEENWQLKSGTISQDSDGKYYCSLLFEFEKDIKPIKAQTAIGLDYSSSELYVDCFGNKPDFPKPYRSAQKKLAKEQRILSHKTKGGKNRAKQKKRVAKVHKKISNQRKNFLHNLSTAIAKHYDIVCIEDLNIKAISRGLRLGKSTLDNGWCMFTTMLSYKLAERGKYLSKVDRFFPSSKLCSVCNHKKDDLTLSQRTYICDSCGSILDRDTNAARNILREGVRLIMNHSNYGDSLLCISGLPESWQEATASISGV